jgi:hypothetical protein
MENEVARGSNAMVIVLSREQQEQYSAACPAEAFGEGGACRAEARPKPSRRRAQAGRIPL